MPDQNEPKGLTAEHTIERLERFADGAFAAGATGVRLSFDEFREVIAMARLSLTLQRRAEEAEAKVAELETQNAKRSEFFKALAEEGILT